MELAQNAPLHERFKYTPHMLTQQEVIDALEELEAWRTLAEDFGIEDDEGLRIHLNNLEENQCKNHEDYDDLKSFFDDCVEALNSRWPCAEAYDMNLRGVICNAITRGDVEEVEE